MAKRKETALDLFLDFIQTDLSSLSKAEQTEVTSWLESLLSRSDIEKKREPLELGDIERIHRYLKQFFTPITEKIRQLEHYQDEGWKPDDKAEFFPQLGLLNQSVTIRLEVGIPHDPPKRSGGKYLVRPKPGAVRNARLRLNVQASGDIEETVLYHFVQSLERIPLGALRQCLECGRWFVHLTKKTRQYCSSKCASRRINRDRREEIKREEPEAYREELKRGRERAHKSYIRKVRKKLPSAKPARNPRN